MRFRTFVLLAVSAAVPLAAQTLPSAPPADAHAAKLADIRKMLALTGGDKLADQLLNAMTASLNSDEPGAKEFFAAFHEEVTGAKVVEMMVGIYDKYLTDEDVQGLIRFYESPAGRKLIEMTPKIVAETMVEARVISERVMQKVKEKHAK